MACITCPKCRNPFDSSDTANQMSPLAAAAVLGAGGAALGARVGLASGGAGMAATVPFGIVGGVVGFLGAKSIRRCPACHNVFKL